MELIAVITTVADTAQADALAGAAVEQGLAACVQAETVRSTYRWKGETVAEPEVRLLFKTTRTRYAALEAWLRARHPYELPAIFALPVAEASADYADWVRTAVDGV
ncbi:divalent-cation tolerance protein CutA [Xylophilus sp.]|uniref:divalent-cation tolerance protein CutA n=1 Tax=Xylophilus sp. TaxID=2653893 RepID=UPI002D802C88|nr:divalent-cation tolerance protein CutA [Xylophilus sp.]